MPGFRLPEETVDLYFDDGPYKGLEIKARLNVPMAFLRYFVEWGDKPTPKGKEVEDLAEVMGMWAAEALVSWNLEDRHGKPVPADATGMMALDMMGFLAVLRAWSGQIGAVAAPLGDRLTAGGTSRTPKPRRSRRRSPGQS